MMQRQQRDNGTSLARRRAESPRRSVLDVLLQPPFAELTLARGLMTALAPGADAAPFVPAIQLTEKDGAYVLDVALPGFKKDDIDIEVSGNEITVSGTYERERSDAKQHYSEMQQGSFTRTVVLPSEIDPDNVSASFEDGVLRITAKPSAPLSAKKIPVTGYESASGSAQRAGT
jgi:HSP20 family protein